MKTITVWLEHLHWWPWVPAGKSIHEPEGEGASTVEGDVYVVLHRDCAGVVWVAYANQPVTVYLRGDDGRSRKLEMLPE